MRSNNLRNINTFYKKIVWVVILVIFCTLLYIPKTQVNAVETPITGNTNEIKILEIQPGNQFILGASTELTSVADCTTQVIGGKQVKITHVTMQQFISMVDEINGKYDVVVVGRKNTGLNSTYNNQYPAYTSTSTPYRDYTNPFSQKLSYLPLSTWEPSSNWKNNFTTLDTNKKFGEYYAENDITQKRANELIKMIDSKQLVYMDNSVFNATASKAITSTNLYKLFVNKKSADNNFINDQSLVNLTVNQIITKYTSILQELKRPQVNQITKPTDDSNLTAAVSLNRNMKFNITLDGQKSETLKAKLFLDINGDGLFKDVELVKTLDLQEIVGQTNYNLNYTLDSYFVGYLDWKIEIVRDNGVKTNILGNSKYKPLMGKKQVRVLQIIPDNRNLINLSTNSTFLSKINNSVVSNDYQLVIDVKKVTDVENEGSNFKLNGKYDMVIIGFADSYGQMQINNQYVLNEIEAFIRTGQSVLFTHDTITPALTNQLNSNYSNTGPKKLTQRFRDYVGQARYKDPYRSNSSGTIDETDIYKTYAKDSNGNLQLTDKTIPHDVFNYNKADDTSGNNAIPAYSLGIAAQGMVSRYQFNWSSSWDYINKVKRINTAQISQYPFQLSNEISVANTHTQWYQLNLEDPDVVPWYNMSSSSFDTGDARNYYYTYSKGNITYSGTGHSGGFTDAELEFFINTMIKAERGANHAPDIKCSIPKENVSTTTEIVNDVIAGGKHIFTVDTEDLEHELVNMHVTIDGQELTSDNIQVTLKNRGGTDTTTMNNKVFEIDTKDFNREAIEIKIPDSKLQSVGGNNVTIKIDATDPQGAKREKSYILKAINAPRFTINANLSTLTTIDTNDQIIPTSVRESNSIKVEKTSRVKAGYTIEPQALEYGEAIPNSMTKEVAILIDSSMDNVGNKMDQSKNAIRDNILNYYFSQDSNLRDDVKMDIMSYGKTVNEKKPYINSSDKDINQVPIDYRNKLQQQLDSINYDGSTERNLGQAIGKAVDFFNNNNQEASGKTIIIVSYGNPTDNMDPTILQTIKDNNYNIIMLAVSNSSAVGNPYSTLLQWHNSMGGLPGDYYISRPDGGGVYNDIKNVIAPQLSVALGSYKYKTYILKDLKLNFNLGSDIDLDKGLIDNPDSYDSKEYLKNMPSIKYIAREEGNPKKLVYYGYFEDAATTVNNKIYQTDFIIKPNQQSNLNIRVFTGDNSLNYLDVVNAAIKKSIDTPILNLDETKVEHGIYKGISNGKANLDTTDSLKFAKDSIVPFAANITGMNSSSNLTITIDPNTQINEKPKVYKIDGGELKLIGTFSDTDNPRVFQLNNFDGTSSSNIIVLYSVKLGEIPLSNEQKYTNTVIANGISSSAKIAQSDKRLPDLF